jgi:hypothetical protein
MEHSENMSEWSSVALVHEFILVSVEGARDEAEVGRRVGYLTDISRVSGSEIIRIQFGHPAEQEQIRRSTEQDVLTILIVLEWYPS